MKKLTRLISIATMLQLAVCWTISAFASEPDTAVVRAVYGAEATPAIAQSVGLLTRISDGDRFAVVQLGNGTWGLVLLAPGTNPVVLDQIALPLAGQAELASAGQVKLLHLLTPRRGVDTAVTQIAGVQP
jgi:hypothetical protein